MQLGLVPVLVDVDPKTLAIDLDSAKSVMSPNIRGMFLISILGQPPNMSKYLEFCNEHKLILLEDNCESLGAKHDGRYLGNFGAMSSFSFYFSHHISTIEGGMITTNDDALADDLRSARSHGWTRERRDAQQWTDNYPALGSKFMFITPGYNVRPTEIQAAIGLCQLKKLDGFIESRRQLARNIFSWIEESSSWLKIIGSEYLGYDNDHPDVHSWMTIPFVTNDDKPGAGQKLMRFLDERGVECRPIIAGNIARQPATLELSIKKASSLETSDKIFDQGFMIGCHADADPESLKTLEAALKELKGVSL